MISLLAPLTWCSSEAESWVFTIMAYCVQGLSGMMRWPGSNCSLSPSVARRGGSTSAITQLLEPQASCPSNSVTFWKGLEKNNTSNGKCDIEKEDHYKDPENDCDSQHGIKVGAGGLVWQKQSAMPSGTVQSVGPLCFVHNKYGIVRSSSVKANC